MDTLKHDLPKTGSKILEPVIGSRHQRSIIYLEGVTVDFDGFKALSNLNLVVDYHELRVIIGPNGAGKSTLLDAISGKVQPVSGRIVFGQGTDLIGLRENEITALGIGRKFQTPSVYTTLPVWDNLDLSLRRSSKGVFATLWSKSRQEELDKIGKYIMPDPTPEKGFFYRSDHISFAKKGVPVLYADSGVDKVSGGIKVGLEIATVAKAAGLAIEPKNCLRSRFFITSP